MLLAWLRCCLRVTEQEDGLGIKGIREVVLAYGEDVGRYARMSSALGAVGSPAEGLPDVWEVPCPVTGDMVRGWWLMR